jgi:hypothetical protein
LKKVKSVPGAVASVFQRRKQLDSEEATRSLRLPVLTSSRAQ